MPSQPLVETSSWDFGPVIDLIDSDTTDVGSPAVLPRKRSLNAAKHDTTLKLGSFGKLWEKLGISVEEPLPVEVESVERQKDQLDSVLPNSVDSEAFAQDAQPHSPPDDIDAANGITDVDHDSRSSIEETGRPDDSLIVMTKKQRYNARKRANKVRKAEKLLQKEREMEEKRSQEQKEQEELKNRLQDLQSPAHLEAPIVTPKVLVNKGENGSEQLSQQTARSRSNVGAKIRPATPTQAIPIHDTPIFPEVTGNQLYSPSPVPFQSNPADGHVPILLPPNFTPNPPAHYLSQNGPVVFAPNTPSVGANYALANLSASLQSQYPALFTYSQPPPGFTAPLNGNANVFIPGSAYGLVPSTVQTTAPRTTRTSKRLAVRSQEDKNFEFLTKLITNFPEDKKWLVSPMRLSSDKMSPEGIHVFVDASNILIGFKDLLKKGGSPDFDMSFDCLALLLERRRPVAKRVYAGSTRETAPIASNEKFNELAGAVGYEKNIYEQVFKSREITERQKFFKDVDRLGWMKATQKHSGSGSSGSDSETGAAPTTPTPTPKWVEQGVDEGLHLKMCQSIIDCEVPSMMILATGDGAGAEYSDGFLAHVERALKKGWIVELVSWKQQLSGGYRNRKFRAKWGDKFRIIELDEYMGYMTDG